MNRSHPRNASTWLLAVAVACALALAFGPAVTAADQPNFVVIFADDD